jgi:hypothetical protein
MIASISFMVVSRQVYSNYISCYEVSAGNVIKLRDKNIFTQRNKGAKEAFCIFISYAPLNFLNLMVVPAST